METLFILKIEILLQLSGGESFLEPSGRFTNVLGQFANVLSHFANVVLVNLPTSKSKFTSTCVLSLISFPHLELFSCMCDSSSPAILCA